MRRQAPKMPEKAELGDVLKLLAESMRQQADALELLAMAHRDEDSHELLGNAGVQAAIGCGVSKASEILRRYGEGSGKMRRIERGRLIQLWHGGYLTGQAIKEGQYETE